MLILVNYALCPTCGGVLKVPEVLSWNSIGAVRWSDGYAAGPFMLADLGLGTCPHCSSFVWQQELTMDSSLGPNVFAPRSSPRVRMEPEGHAEPNRQ
jgi:hypothetical protein